MNNRGAEPQKISTKTRLKQDQRTLTMVLGVAIVVVVLLFIWLGANKRSNHASGAASPQNEARPVIVLDAGHGGIDGGAIGCNQTQEAPLNLSVTMKTKDLLECFGCQVVLTRTSDAGLEDVAANTVRDKKKSDMHRRLAIAQETKNGIFISIHQNASPYTSANGSVVYYSKNTPGSLLLANAIQSTLVGKLQPNNKRVIVGAGSNLYLLHKANWPAVLVECGFITNANEVNRLKEQDYQQQLSLGLVTGLAQSWPQLWNPEATDLQNIISS